MKTQTHSESESEILRNNAINYALQKADHQIAELRGHLYTSYAVIIFLIVLLTTVGLSPKC